MLFQWFLMDPCWAPPRNWEMLPEWSVANGFRPFTFLLILLIYTIFLLIFNWSVANGFPPFSSRGSTCGPRRRAPVRNVSIPKGFFNILSILRCRAPSDCQECQYSTRITWLCDKSKIQCFCAMSQMSIFLTVSLTISTFRAALRLRIVRNVNKRLGLLDFVTNPRSSVSVPCPKCQ